MSTSSPCCGSCFLDVASVGCVVFTIVATGVLIVAVVGELKMGDVMCWEVGVNGR